MPDPTEETRRRSNELDPTAAFQRAGDRAAIADSATAGYAGGTHEGPCPTVELRRERGSGPWFLELGSASGAVPLRLAIGQSLTFGSGPAADVRVSDSAVSAVHCSVLGTSQGVTVTDLDSKNGVFVGSARVASALLTGKCGYFVIGRSVVNVRRETPDDALAMEEPLPGLIGQSAPMRRVMREVRSHAKMRVPVLLQGESGTGKDVIARALHTLSKRPGTYLPLNVGALPETLADAELFGHRRGAFTGAVTSRSGAFEQAHKGTLFLDEVADLSPAVQIKLLRVVEDGIVRPVGATSPVNVEVRIVSASWASLPDRVLEGRFRNDLYHRLSTVVIRVPPLRERKSDLPMLADALLARMRDDVGAKRLSSAALGRLLLHDWPGNVRELIGTLYRAAVASSELEIDAHHLDFAAAPRAPDAGRQLTRAQAKELLVRSGNNVSAAARAARVARSTFRSWLERNDAEP